MKIQDEMRRRAALTPLHEDHAAMQRAASAIEGLESDLAAAREALKRLADAADAAGSSDDCTREEHSAFVSAIRAAYDLLSPSGREVSQ